MSIALQKDGGIARIPPFPVYRFTVDEYHRLGESGILAEDDRVELLEGWIVPKMNHNPRHDATVDQGDELISALLPSEWRVRVQSAITTDDSEPEPDLAVVRGPAMRYKDQHPTAQDIALLVEVSDTTLLRDRAKCRIYGAAGVLIYWIVNLLDSTVEVYSDPTGSCAAPGYRHRQDYRLGDSVPLVIAGQQLAVIRVGDLLPH